MGKFESAHKELGVTLKAYVCVQGGRGSRHFWKFCVHAMWTSVPHFTAN